jgi:SAM-dependent methyltransferase
MGHLTPTAHLPNACREVSADPGPTGSPRTVLREVLTRLQSEAARTILDVPAGRGPLVPHLRKLGYTVSAADIRPDLFQVTGIACDYADLNQGLPYDSASFDAVLCCNGIHRVYAVAFAVSEMARVLRPGGRLLLSFPNFSSLSRRTRFLLTGSLSPSFVRMAENPDRSVGNLRMPVTPAQVLAAVGASGLRVVGIRGIRRSPGKRRPLRWFYLPLIAPIRLACLLSSRRVRRALWLDEVSSVPLLLNDFVVLETRKTASPHEGPE